MTGQPLLLKGICIARDERPDSLTAVPWYTIHVWVPSGELNQPLWPGPVSSPPLPTITGLLLK